MSNNAHHRNLMQEFWAAAQAWWVEAEFETQLYATELTEYKYNKPMPQLRDWLINQSKEK